jgi:hypothetical protein
MTLAIQAPITRDPGAMTLPIGRPHDASENFGRWPHVPGDHNRTDHANVGRHRIIVKSKQRRAAPVSSIPRRAVCPARKRVSTWTNCRPAGDN